jgi:hypothetical protein
MFKRLSMSVMVTISRTGASASNANSLYILLYNTYNNFYCVCPCFKFHWHKGISMAANCEIHETYMSFSQNWKIFVLISGFSTKIFVEWLEPRPSVLPIYKKLITAGLRIWVYRFVSLHCGDSNQWFNEIFFITLTLSFLDGSVVIQMEEFLYYLQDTA